jgi:hypothetical protein
MILRYFHNFERDIPNIEGVKEFIQRRYQVEIDIRQFKPRNRYVEPYAGITEIVLDEGKLDGKLEEVIQVIKDKLN